VRKRTPLALSPNSETGRAFLRRRSWTLEKNWLPGAERDCELCVADSPRDYATAHYQSSEARPRARRAHPAKMMRITSST